MQHHENHKHEDLNKSGHPTQTQSSRCMWIPPREPIGRSQRCFPCQPKKGGPCIQVSSVGFELTIEAWEASNKTLKEMRKTSNF